MRRVASLAVTGLLVLGACSGGEKAEGNAAATSEKSAADSASSGDTDITANPKPGLWEMTMASANGPAGKPIRTCIGEPKPGTSAFAPPTSPGTTCARHDVKRVADGVQVDMECTTEGIQTVSTMMVTGDFNSSFKNEMKMTMSGANLRASMPKDMAMTTEAKYLGACPADMKPGEVRM